MTAFWMTRSRLSVPPSRKRCPNILKAKPGELRARWARPDEHNGPDVCYAWGKGVNHCDGSLLATVLGTPRARINLRAPLGSPRYMWAAYDESLLKELEKRGYDLTTIQFSIMKKDI